MGERSGGMPRPTVTSVMVGSYWPLMRMYESLAVRPASPEARTRQIMLAASLTRVVNDEPYFLE